MRGRDGAINGVSKLHTRGGVLEHLRFQVLGGEKNWSAENLSEWSGVEVTDCCGEVGNGVSKGCGGS